METIAHRVSRRRRSLLRPGKSGWRVARPASPAENSAENTIAFRLLLRKRGKAFPQVITRAVGSGARQTWVAATSLRNYFLRDPFLDWAEHHHQAYIHQNPTYGAKFRSTTSLSPRRGAKKWAVGCDDPLVARGHSTGGEERDFPMFIMAQGVKFEKKVVSYLYQKFEGANVCDVGGKSRKRTVEAMNTGVPVIYSGFLRDDMTKTYGIPDLIVRSDWVNKLVETPAVPAGEETVCAPDLRRACGRAPLYHYRVVDIKFSTLHLRSDGEHLLNSGSIPAYKGQLYVYNRALAALQGYDPGVAYILGKRWKYTALRETFRGQSCLDRLGVVDFRAVDAPYKERTEAATAWVNAVRLEGAAWDPLAIPAARSELYPNMSNASDYPWRGVKEYIADETNEITQLWMCGTKERAAAHAKGVYKWTDCTCSTLSVLTPFKKNILDQILALNTPPKVARQNRRSGVVPRRLKGAPFGKIALGLEFYVDFETVNDVVTDNFDTFPLSHTSALVFMIGVGYKNYKQDWVHRCFAVSALTLSEQARICTAFCAYLHSVVRENLVRLSGRPALFHWGRAEPSMWRKARGPLLADVFDWRNLLALFRAEPIIVEGCLNFGLKSVTKALHTLGHVGTYWDKQSGCTDGVSAMLCAAQAYSECRDRHIKCTVDTSPRLAEISAYNETDCRVLSDIVAYLRENHL